jgi:hypothetical protein
MRQFYGINKWYQKQNARADRTADFFLYFLCLMPFVAAHFRGDSPWASYYSERDLFFFPSAGLHAFALALYSAGVAAWLGYEFLQRRRGRRTEWNRILALATPAVIYGYCFLIGRTWIEILLPLVVAHGAAYIGLTSLAVSRTRNGFAFKKAFVFVTLTCLFFGAVEFNFDRGLPPAGDLALSAAMAFYLCALFCHYVFDGFLWKRTHPEAALVYGLS